jgi:hypothetical protein
VIPTLIATRYQDRFLAAFPRLSISNIHWFSFVVYPLSGGFRRWSLLGSASASLGERLERALEPILGRLLGFRLMMVLEKR